MDKRLQAAIELQKRRAARTSLLKFTEFTHPSWESGEHHATLCRYLEKLMSQDIQFLCVNAPPRHSKTELASRRFPAYYLGHHPDRQVICASANGDLAGDIGANIRDIIRDQEYQKLFGTKLRTDAKAAGRWVTDKGGICYSAGVGGVIVGRGANLMVIDDPHGGRENADSPRQRKVVSDWYFGDAITRLQRPYCVLLILTRWHEDDLAGRLIPPESEWEPVEGEDGVFKAAEWHVIKFEAIKNEGTDDEIALWPGVEGSNFGYPLEELRKKRTSMMRGGRSREWRAQYQQCPVAEEGTYMKREWFDERWTTLQPSLRYYIAGDFAVTDSTEARDPDWTEFGVFAIAPDDRLYVVDWWRGRKTAEVWVERMLDLAEKYPIEQFFGEGGVIRRAVEPIIARRMRERRVNFLFDKDSWISPTRDKATRARPFQYWASSGRVVFPRHAPWAQDVIDQIVGFPAARHDDAFDVCSLMCSQIDELQPGAWPTQGPFKKRDSWSRVRADAENAWKWT